MIHKVLSKLHLGLLFIPISLNSLSEGWKEIIILTSFLSGVLIPNFKISRNTYLDFYRYFYFFRNTGIENKERKFLRFLWSIYD